MTEAVGRIDLWLPCREGDFKEARTGFLTSVADVLPKTQGSLFSEVESRASDEVENSPDQEPFEETKPLLLHAQYQRNQGAKRLRELHAECLSLRREHRMLAPSPFGRPCAKAQGKIQIFGGDTLTGPQFADMATTLSCVAVSAHGRYVAFAGAEEFALCEARNYVMQHIKTPDPPSGENNIIALKFFFEDEDSSAVIFIAGDTCWGWEPLYSADRTGSPTFMRVTAVSGQVEAFSQCPERKGRCEPELLLLATASKHVEIWDLQAHCGQPPDLLRVLTFDSPIRAAVLIVDSAAALSVVAYGEVDGHLSLDVNDVRSPSCFQASLQPQGRKGHKAWGGSATLAPNITRHLLAVGSAGGWLEVYDTQDYVGAVLPARVETGCGQDDSSPHVAWCGAHPILAASCLSHEVLIYQYFRNGNRLELLNVLRTAGDVYPPGALGWAAEEGLLIAIYAAEWQFWVLELDDHLALAENDEASVKVPPTDTGEAGDWAARLEAQVLQDEEEEPPSSDEEEYQSDVEDEPTIFKDNPAEEEGSEDEHADDGYVQDGTDTSMMETQPPKSTKKAKAQTASLASPWRG